ncbi:MAG TPA: hypothetical protein VGM27_24820 [Acidobacteriaceae bacterium]
MAYTRFWEMASNLLTGFACRQKTGFFAGATEIEAQLLDGTVAGSHDGVGGLPAASWSAIHR